MKNFSFAIGICLLAARFSIATPQANDTMVIGGNTYGIFQLPLSDYWYLDGEPTIGRLPTPKFDLTSSANWRGYIAEWSISREKLYLLSVKGTISGMKVQNRRIIDKSFPIHAEWYTGKVFVSVGDLNDETHRFEYVLEFSVKDGNVMSTSFHEDFSIPMSLNGLPEKPQPN